MSQWEEGELPSHRSNRSAHASNPATLSQTFAPHTICVKRRSEISRR